MSSRKKKQPGSKLLDPKRSTFDEMLEDNDSVEGLNFDSLFAEAKDLDLEMNTFAQTTNTIVQAAVKLTELIVNQEKDNHGSISEAVDTDVKGRVFGLYHEAIKEVIAGISSGMDDFIGD